MWPCTAFSGTAHSTLQRPWFTKMPQRGSQLPGPSSPLLTLCSHSAGPWMAQKYLAFQALWGPFLPSFIFSGRKQGSNKERWEQEQGPGPLIPGDRDSSTLEGVNSAAPVAWPVLLGSAWGGSRERCPRECQDHAWWKEQQPSWGRSSLACSAPRLPGVPWESGPGPGHRSLGAAEMLVREWRAFLLRRKRGQTASSVCLGLGLAQAVPVC